MFTVVAFVLGLAALLVAEATGELCMSGERYKTAAELRPARAARIVALAVMLVAIMCAVAGAGR